MRTNWTGYGVLAVIAVVIAASLVWQHRKGNALRREIAQKQFGVAELTRLEAEQSRLKAAQASQTELEKAQKDRALMSSLRAEIEAMKQRAETISRTKTTSAVAKVPRLSLKDRPTVVSAAEWENVGAETPEATFETALWAATGGDVDALARLLSFDTEARTKITSLFIALPAALQNELGTPERLLALLAAKDVPFGGAAKIWAEYGGPADTKISAQIVDADGKSKQVRLSVRQEGNRWKFVVPPSAVEKYAAQLQVPGVLR